MKITVITILFLVFATSSFANYRAGLSFDSSSNILMRTNGKSGTMLSLYGDAVLRSKLASVSYSLDSGLLDKYDGVQYHYHKLKATRPLFSRGSLMVSASADAGFARYGDISLLTGYNQYGGTLRLRSYLRPSLLLRTQGSLGRRSYRSYKSENFDIAEGYIRFDRFLATGTTLRGQVDIGVRRYTNQSGSLRSELYGYRLRAAQSLGSRMGAWVEIRNRGVRHKNPARDDIRTDGTEDVYAPPEGTIDDVDRIFLDDRYKFSSFSVHFQTKYLFRKPGGSITFNTSMAEKTYKGSLASSYWYLPKDGWGETEWRAVITMVYQPGFLPDMVHPSLDIYYVKVRAYESNLSYKSTGMSMRFDLY